MSVLDRTMSALAALMRRIATLGFIGYLPIAPGTFGSAVTMTFFIFLKPTLTQNLIFILLIIPLGIIASGVAEVMLEEKDSRHIVIDEVGGYAISVLFLQGNPQTYVLAFLFFRFFDIIKPPPIRYLEKKVPGGTGIMLDDLIAGIYTNITIQLWNRLF